MTVRVETTLVRGQTVAALRWIAEQSTTIDIGLRGDARLSSGAFSEPHNVKGHSAVHRAPATRLRPGRDQVRRAGGIREAEESGPES